MRFESEVHSGVRVVTIFGRWTGGVDDDALRDQLREWLAGSERHFIMDMSQLELLNSIGLGRLVSYYTTLTRQGGEARPGRPQGAPSTRGLRGAHPGSVRRLRLGRRGTERGQGQGPRQGIGRSHGLRVFEDRGQDR